MKKYQKYLLTSALILWILALIPYLNKGICPFKWIAAPKKEIISAKPSSINDAQKLLKERNNQKALSAFEEILNKEPGNPDALWGKAEILRRQHKDKKAQEILNKILESNPQHAPSLTSLAYIRYKDNNLKESLRLAKAALKTNQANKESQAMAYMVLGAINAKRSQKGWLLDKVIYGTQIKGYLQKALKIDPELPEVHLGLGTFYLKAPALAGGDINKAIEEYNLAVNIAPSFSDAYLGLAQAFQKKGDLQKYNLYLKKAKELDPENEELKKFR